MTTALTFTDAHKHAQTHCRLKVKASVPGHLYSFLACAMSPLLSLVRWPIAGRTPFSSLDGRMVSRNIPLQRREKRQHVICRCNTSVKLNNNLTVWTSKQFSPNHCSFVFSLTGALELTGEWEGLYKRVWRRLKSILSRKKCKVNPWHFLLPNPNFFHHFKWCRCIKKLEKIS